MFIIESYNKIGVQLLLWVSELVVILHFHQKENPDTLAIVVINQTSLCVCVVDNPFQEFDAGEYRSPAHHHVQIHLSNIPEDFIIEFSCIGIVVWGIFWEFLPLDFLEKFFPMRKHYLGPNVRLYVSKCRRMSENFLGGCIDDGHWFWRKV